MRALRFLTVPALLSVLALAAPFARAATPLPTHVFSPYFEMWTGDSISGIAQQSGAKYLTLAFLETTSKTSCTLAWNGSRTQTVATSPTPFLADIQALRAAGGDVIPSLGGWSADQGGTEIGDSCVSVPSILAAYQQLVATYDVSRIDMDIEGRSLNNTAGIDRRNKAIAQLQAWAASSQVNRPITISYTLPTTRNGLEASGLAILDNAIANGVRIDIVQPMVFDYYDKVTNITMGQSAINAVAGLHNQLASRFPSKTSAQIWAMEGATIMNGLDDYPKKTESTSVADATQLYNFARTNGMSVLSMWAIQRDNGGCPGNTGANNCSGIMQNTWDFTNALKGFTT
jgi:hypothetical protein